MSDIPEKEEMGEELSPNETQRVELPKGTLLWVVVILTLVLLLVFVVFFFIIRNQQRDNREIMLEKQRQQYKINWK